MRKTLAIIGGALAVLLAAVLLYAATKPDVFRVQRAASIKAPPEKIAAVLEGDSIEGLKRAKQAAKAA